MKLKVSVILLLSMVYSAMVLNAQSNPSIELVVSQSHIEYGDLVNVDVMIHDGTNVAGLDVGINVDESCLRIVERQAGDYLPMTEGSGAFSPYSVLNENNTRLAIALMDRTRYVNGDGVFYRIVLEAICEEQIANITADYAQISSYIDPDAEIIEVMSYELDKATLNVQNTYVSIGNTSDSDILELTQVASEIVRSETSDMVTQVPNNSSVSSPESDENEMPPSVFFIIIITIVSITILIAIFFITSRKDKSENSEKI